MLNSSLQCHILVFTADGLIHSNSRSCGVGGGDTLVQKAEAIQHYRNMRPVQARTWKGRGCPPTWKPEKCGNYEETGSFANFSAPACGWPGELGTTPTNV